MKETREAIFAALTGDATITALISSTNIFSAWVRADILSDVMNGTRNGAMCFYFSSSGRSDYDALPTPAVTLYIDAWTRSPTTNAQVFDALCSLLGNSIIVSSNGDNIYASCTGSTEAQVYEDLYLVSTTWRLYDAS